jgi:hypothetical protein
MGRHHQKENTASCDNILLMILACLCENTGLLWSKRLRSRPALPRQINGPDDKNVRDDPSARFKLRIKSIAERDNPLLPPLCKLHALP